MFMAFRGFPQIGKRGKTNIIYNPKKTAVNRL